MSMIRLFTPLLAAACALLCSAAGAQQPPSDREIAVYAGLHAAAAEGDVAEIEKLIREGENPNVEDSRSRTPLHVAAYRKHYKAVETLLRLGADPNALDLQRFDIVTIAAVQNDLELLKIALAGGAKPDNITTQSDSNALINAAHLGHVDIVRALVEAHANLDHVNRGSWTALIVAVVLGNGGKNYVEIVDLLVKAGADTEIKDRGGMTALAHARARKYEEMVKILGAASGRKT
jgi:ankyrin repeat protein